MARTAMEEAMAMLRSERISGAGEREGGRQRAPPNPGSQSQRDSQHSPGMSLLRRGMEHVPVA